MSTNPIIISVQGGSFEENATMVSVIRDSLRERGFTNVASDSGLPGDDRTASEYMLNNQVPYLRQAPFVVEGLSDFNFRTSEFSQPLNLHQEQVFDIFNQQIPNQLFAI